LYEAIKKELKISKVKPLTGTIEMLDIGLGAKVCELWNAQAESTVNPCR
jgi:hypothetical protein